MLGYRYWNMKKINNKKWYNSIKISNQPKLSTCQK